ncbi:hypothetical protein BZA70DRAFT_4150 [Myxozyma melibiosi]|uniref:ABC transporter domain-containing protein n=1 Tax=Myxozyma melibiosi TaxID=54550 RepID=A0ABR1FB58_9ASCO
MAPVGRQTLALVRKCFIVFWRTIAGSVFRAFVLPVVFAFAICLSQYLFAPSGRYGIETPYPLRSVAEVLGSRDFVYLSSEKGGLTDEIRNVMDKVTSGLPADQVIALDDPVDLLTVCRQSLRGASNCLVAIEWHVFDSENKLYNYTIRADAGLNHINVKTHNTDAQRYILPTQWALDAALLDLDVDDAPQTMAYTTRSQKQHEDDIRQNFMTAFRNYLSAALYLSMIGVVYHLTGEVAAERERGIATLIDSMGCKPIARILSFFTSFSLFYLPGWVVFGVATGSLLFKKSMGIQIVFHILSGFSNVSFGLFLAQPFKQAQFSGIFGTAVCILLAVMSIVQRAVGPHNAATSGVLGFIFPPMNYVFFLQECARFQYAEKAINLLHVPPEGFVAPGIYWIGSVVQTFVYFGLALVVDKLLYSICPRVVDTLEDDRALALQELSKTYYPWTFNGMFSKSKKLPPVAAVNSVDLNFRRGEIFCLLGANGSGKTTSLDLICGVQKPTSGRVVFGSQSSLGFCPQRNVMWDLLTVDEHVKVLTTLKNNDKLLKSEFKEEVDSLISGCDLVPKRSALSKTLSGGQKRKLQLAMMLAGNSEVCCIDEVSSGLDPISRRKIWDILLASRGKRTMILSTHFLDEADLLADHIAILAKGELKADGSPVELKQRLGSGYHVFSIVPASGKETVFDLTSASQAVSLITQLEQEGHKEIRISGPQLEDVFLKLVADSDSEIKELLNENAMSYQDDGSTEQESIGEKGGGIFKAVSAKQDFELDLKGGQIIGFWGQLKTMLWKRVIVTRRNPMPTIGVILVPLIVGAISSRFVGNYVPETCDAEDQVSRRKTYSFSLNLATASVNMVLGPQSSLSTYLTGIQSYLGIYYSSASEVNESINRFAANLTMDDSIPSFVNSIRTNYTTITPGGLYLDSPRTVAFRANSANKIAQSVDGVILAPIMLNMFDNIIGNGSATIITDYSPFQYPWTPSTGDSLLFVVFFSLAMSVFPAFCALYPTVERLRHVRALHYSNGLRVLPLWVSHLFFDFAGILLVCVILVGVFAGRSSDWYGLGYLFAVMILNAFASILLAFLCSMVSLSQLSAFAMAAGFQCAYFLVYILAYLFVDVFVSARRADTVIRIVTYVLCIFAPVANLVRAIFLSLNLFGSMCHNSDTYTYYADIRAYGQPILYLALQSIVLFGILIWWDSGRFRIHFQRKFKPADAEEKMASLDEDIYTEIQNVESPSNPGGLRVVHLSKRFGKFVAVEDVTFGVARSECFALLGPNGAGKSTTFNMIRGEIAASSGDVFVENTSVSSDRARARTFLGVCPQFDAIDRMNVTETLEFYARLRGLRSDDLVHNVENLIYAVGLSNFRDRMAAKLSGGNRRKLSLGIALMANPSVLLLDEPSSGMDAASKRVMWRTLAKVSGDRSILLTTHSMEEADALASRAGILAKNMLAVGTCDRLRQRYSNAFFLHFLCKGGVSSTTEEMNDIYEWAVAKFKGHAVQIQDMMYHGQVRVAVEGRGVDGDIYRLLDILRAIEEDRSTLSIEFYSVAQASLEQVFLSIVGAHDIAEEGYAN